jgi:hypothetical protein
VARDACAGSSPEASQGSFAAIEYLQTGSVVAVAEVVGEVERLRHVAA